MNLQKINESALSKTDRLGLAWCRLNCWQWDDILGPKPAGFDNLPGHSENPRFRWQIKKPCKADYTRGPMLAIESIIGKANISRCWNTFAVGMTEGEWFRWYCQELSQKMPG